MEEELIKFVRGVEGGDRGNINMEIQGIKENSERKIRSSLDY